ncbi:MULTISPECIES: 3'-5' exonuclease [unclassified Enterococcus]|uniref:3'-5' exonuclease n=1 Tax=unclassified Enterococcus TaxID=2608891 RepID=UPI00190795DC|nr:MULTISPECIES: 3'-5' exonuclease [unclassified Enterococcus]MBK0038801.1 ATP-binding domain-containing protein [Enterococcus sp. S52]MBK0071798.1 ATP-binding domain-containing protein [Enterococcus sp. S53]MBK0142079.1 ATP-binding domain-containing protein [Enterococcus sp. S76]MBK0145778.1 ATP-binding domain-containing protein [Enterococcus sp. S77]
MIDYCQKQLESDLNEESFKNFVLEIVKLIKKESIYQIYPEYEQGIYLEQVLNEFVNLFWEEYVNSSDFKNAIENFRGDNTIPIMTIHKSKGLEYEAVYFVGLEDSAFWNFENQPDVDRSAFFVAISRAKKYLAFSYCSNRSSLKNVYNPSGAQKNTNINEFFELLMVPGVATIES